MKRLPVFQKMLSICVSTILLSGCSNAETSTPGVTSMVGESRALQQVFDVAPRSDVPLESAHAESSWIAPDAASQDLLYVLDNTNVNVYSYPHGKLEGTLRHFYLAEDACVDKKGNVLIVNLGLDRIFEYAHAGTKRIKNIDVPTGAVGCSIDPTSGDLAVAGSTSPSNGGVAIFKKAQGKPKYYADPGFYEYYFCGYDDKGNLFVDGQSSAGSGHVVLAELPKRGNALQTISMNQTIEWPGEVQWDGKHLAIQDQTVPVIYQFEVNGSQAMKVGATNLDGAGELHQTWIQDRTVILPNICGTSCDYSDVLFYKYPAGGKANKEVKKHVRGPLGVVVSLAPK